MKPLRFMWPPDVQYVLPKPAPTTTCYRKGREFVGDEIDARLIKPTHDDIVQAIRNFAHMAIDEMIPELVWDKKCAKAALAILEGLMPKDVKPRRRKHREPRTPVAE